MSGNRWNGREMGAEFFGEGEDDETSIDFRSWKDIQSDKAGQNGTAPVAHAPPRQQQYVPPPQQYVPAPVYNLSGEDESTWDKAKPLLIGGVIGGVGVWLGLKWLNEGFGGGGDEE